MKLATENRVFESTLKTEAQPFRINANAKAFQILSDRLYEKKELAIVRELLANAVDAHVAVGTKDKPIDLHLPTPLEPYFEIKDYGTGLSEDQIYSLYTTFFASDKTGTNDLIGGLGLGSKSPLAYTDQFSVESRHGGKLARYQIYIGADGVPMVTKMHEIPSIEPSGLTVHVPVAYEHSSGFEAAAREILPYSYVPVKCNSIKPEDIRLKPAFARIQTPEGVTIEILHSRDNTSYVVMGIVPYPVHYRNFGSDTMAYDMLSHIDLRITAPIGMFEIAASREGLSYTKETKDKLEKLCTAAAVPLLEKAVDDVDEAPNMIEAVRRWYNVSNNVYSIAGRLARAGMATAKTRRILESRATPTWQGKDCDILIPEKVSVRFVEQNRRRGTVHTRGVVEGDGKTVRLPLRYFNSIYSQYEHKLYWREKSGIFAPYLETDPQNRLPAMVVFGEKAKVEHLFRQMGIDLATEVTEMSDVKALRTVARQNNKNNLGAAQYDLLIWPDRRMDRLTAAATLARYDDGNLVATTPEQRHTVENQRLFLDSVTSRAVKGACLFVHSSHGKVLEGVLQQGAKPTVWQIFDPGKDRDVLLDIASFDHLRRTSQPCALQVDNKDGWHINDHGYAYGAQFKQLLKALEKEEVDDLLLYIDRNLWHTRLVTHTGSSYDETWTQGMIDAGYFTREEVEANARLMLATLECQASLRQELKKRYSLITNWSKLLYEIYYGSTTHSQQLVSLMTYYLANNKGVQP